MPHSPFLFGNLWSFDVQVPHTDPRILACPLIPHSPCIRLYRSSDFLMPIYFPQSVHPLRLMNEHVRASFTFLCLLCFSLTVTSSGSFFLTLTTWSCSISPTIWTDTVVILNIRIMHSKHPGQGLAHSSSINTSQSNGKVMDAVTNINRSDHFKFCHLKGTSSFRLEYFLSLNIKATTFTLKSMSIFFIHLCSVLI